MTDNTFFEGYEGQEVHFQVGPSTWILTGLIKERNSQVDAEGFYKDKTIGGAYGTFLCHSFTDPNQRGVMKVFKQIPYQGSEYGTAGQRAGQASQDLDYYITSQLEALRILTVSGCQSTPCILSMQIERQNTTDSVPNGYIVFLLLNHLPGVQLSKAIFWAFEDTVRERIRQAFRVAWEDCVKSGVVPVLQNIEHVFWNEAANKAYLIGFRMSEKARIQDVWRDTRWIAWGMAECPDKYRWYKEKNPHPDKSKWKL
ncbi:hypothetical protein BDV30DRAFT_205537 [Aspergillus minisclerotigenes]|uniref:Uncharacterized protein n=1 Tax=Aspergillus minisclerotigenes TaxID=656917 RepID=A0A5N6JDZ7_9EURO|nr:hypothetical protein BDV30DRAFT_205537 [Aspergillus minisclerotigenes]